MVAGLQRHTRKDKVAGKLLGFLCLPCSVCVCVLSLVKMQSDIPGARTQTRGVTCD